ncbi:MAG: helix-turn-helix domain-containing protein [Ignavibacteriaceae bacterium]
MSRYAFAIGSFLKTYRKDHNYRQKEFAYHLGISREYYSRLEEGKAFPSTKLFFLICKITKVNVPFSPYCKTVSELEMCALCSSLSHKNKIFVKRMIKGFIKE